MSNYVVIEDSATGSDESFGLMMYRKYLIALTYSCADYQRLFDGVYVL